MTSKYPAGHVSALLTILIWGTSFISTKILLADFTPIEILFLRFLMGFAALLFICPRRLKGTSRKQELFLAAAGLCGICLYYLLENIALTLTLASNVGVIISAAPFFTAILIRLIMKTEERLSTNFFVGFLSAMAGICMISFSGSGMQLHPAGDLLAVAAAFIWACYSVLMRKISSFGFSTIQITRRVFAYGILFMLPAMVIFGFRPDMSKLLRPPVLMPLLFLGLGASALCFVTWNFAVKQLGAVKTSIYIYLVPVITISASVLILHEPITRRAAVGALLTLFGLMISERKGRRERKKENKETWQIEIRQR